ncbi:L-rhamnose operon transcriptional activator RhaR [Cronobacter universalis NCTC 9529]|nr:L-rhamnose operon transcriptional activator RhaR [Cronobacter universalis NCTC 9529]
MASQLVLRKADFFATPTQPVVVADRYPQNVFAEHTHEFCELVLVWRGNGLHVLNDRPYRITCGDLFYIRAEDRHSYQSVNDLVLHNIIYCPERLKLNVNWRDLLENPRGASGDPRWRLSSQGMVQARQVIDQLEHESPKQDALSHCLAESLFLQLAITLRRHRYQPSPGGAGRRRNARSADGRAGQQPGSAVRFATFLQPLPDCRTPAAPAVPPADGHEHQPVSAPAAHLPGAVPAAPLLVAD